MIDPIQLLAPNFSFRISNNNKMPHRWRSTARNLLLTSQDTEMDTCQKVTYLEVTERKSTPLLNTIYGQSFFPCQFVCLSENEDRAPALLPWKHCTSASNFMEHFRSRGDGFLPVWHELKIYRTLPMNSLCIARQRHATTMLSLSLSLSLSISLSLRFMLFYLLGLFLTPLPSL